MRLSNLLAPIALLAAAPAIAQPAPPAATATASPMLTQRANDLLAILNGGGDPAATFAPEFLAQVPEAQVRAIAQQLAGTFGKATGVRAITAAASAVAGSVVFGYERGTVTMWLAVTPGTTGRIIELRITATESGEKVGATTLDGVGAAFRALPGRTGFAYADLGVKPTIVSAVAADTPIPLGSAFKLVILAELVRQTAAGTRKWDDLVTLDGTELPGGGYNTKPKGTQVTLRELATQMISISDNSATDVLLTTLGRTRVEAMQKTVGIRDPKRNMPFLTTMEAFKLKGIGKGELGGRYLAANAAGRRKLLTGEVASTPGSAIGDLFVDGKPVLNDRIEWFASPADLVRVMDWLRRNTERGPGAEARRILAVNPGIAKPDAARWNYVGFKGGSEPGVINMTLLLQDKAGGWHALTAGWNDPAAPVDTLRFLALVTRAAELAAK